MRLFRSLTTPISRALFAALTVASLASAFVRGKTAKAYRPGWEITPA